MKNKRQNISVLHAKALIPYLEGIRDSRDSESFWMARRIVRRWTEFPSMISKANLYSKGAANVLQEKGISLEILKWAEYGDQTKKSGLNDGPGHSTGQLHHEHIRPVQTLVEELVELPQYTVEAIVNLIQTRAEVAWILKTEQKELDKICRTGNRSQELLDSLNIELIDPNLELTSQMGLDHD